MARRNLKQLSRLDRQKQENGQLEEKPINNEKSK